MRVIEATISSVIFRGNAKSNKTTGSALPDLVSLSRASKQTTLGGGKTNRN